MAAPSRAIFAPLASNDPAAPFGRENERAGDARSSLFVYLRAFNSSSGALVLARSTTMGESGAQRSERTDHHFN